MNIDLISIIIFYSIIFLLFLRYKKRFTMQGIIALYKTGLGIRLMDVMAQMNRKFLKFFATAGIIIGTGGMAFGFVFLVKETLKFLIVPGTPTPLAPILPGIAIPGVPTLSFWHWIIAIFISAIVHEFSHGVIARFYKVPIKSSGIAFLGPVMAAFVEPDEEELKKRKPMEQIGIFAAGPFSNIALGAIFFLIFMYVTAPLFMQSVAPGGITVQATVEGYPAYNANITAPFTILKINGLETLKADQFLNATKELNPGEHIKLETDKGTYELTAAENPKNSSAGFIGLSGFIQKTIPAGRAEGRPWLLAIFSWTNMLAMWLFVINIGMAIFNLLPFMPADGGRMVQEAMTAMFPKRGRQIWTILNLTCITLIVINLLPWIFKLFVWAFQMLVLLVSFAH